MTKDDLVRKYPVLFHMAEVGTWPSIQAHGLLSTSALLDLFQVGEPQRRLIESAWRPRSVPIQRQSLGAAVIRDQKPMPEDALQQCLVGMTPKQWYELINRKTFFWAQQKNLLSLLNAVAYRTRAHWVITVGTAELLDGHCQRVTLCSINSGSTYSGGRRGKDTFKTVEEYTLPSVVELAVDYSVPDIGKLVLSVAEWKGSNKLRVIWTR